jgi:hypothetical protein
MGSELICHVRLITAGIVRGDVEVSGTAMPEANAYLPCAVDHA